MTATAEPINGATYNKAALTVFSSLLIHPDWELEDHLAYLQHEAYIDIETPITYCYWPDGPKTEPLRKFVKSWLNRIERLKEVCHEIMVSKTVNEL